jgi:secondary thiamine-phosphate synthase enzyme
LIFCIDKLPGTCYDGSWSGHVSVDLHEIETQSGALMAVISLSISFSTRGNTEIRDITSEVASAVARSGLQNGIITIFCPSSTSGLTTIEYEQGAVNDFRQLIEEMIPSNRTYAHDATWGDGNGYSHVRSAMVKTSLTIPFIKTKLTLGIWQQVIYIDFDNRPRQRELIFQIIGE